MKGRNLPISTTLLTHMGQMEGHRPCVKDVSASATLLQAKVSPASRE